MMLLFIVILLLAFVTFGASQNPFLKWPQRGSSHDLHEFVTRPELTPPILKTKFHSRERTAPGYLFVAPYDCLGCGKEGTTTYVTQQIGPHIYDINGELVWSSIDIFPNRKVFDFRPAIINGAYHLTGVAQQDNPWALPKAGGIVLDASYQHVNTFYPKDSVDIHELNVLENENSALIGTLWFHEVTFQPKKWTGSLMDAYFKEFNPETNEETFRWLASEHIDLSESSHPPPGQNGGVWDWFHMNSVDKSDEGEYLVSARFTNTIYCVQRDGSIKWRLGGINTSFQADFNFSRQHYARFRGRNDTHTFISFIDNAVDEEGAQATSSVSSLFLVALDLQSKVATSLLQVHRPDGGLTRARGNMQLLPNGNYLGGWGENGYMTEHTSPGGEMVYEARFTSNRFTNYRAYKMDWVGDPKDKPIAKAFVSANYRGNLTTTIYVSWNGATEVRKWTCYSQTTRNGVEGVMAVGSAAKAGFETEFIVNGYHERIFVEAVDGNGKSLSNSTLETTELPLGFHGVGSSEPSTFQPIPPASSMEHMATAFFTGVIFTMICNRFLQKRWKGFRPLG